MSTKSIVNWINKTFDFTNLLKSRIVLYIFFILSIAQLYTYSVTYDYLYAAIFLLVGFLVSFFSKNMIVIMCFALSLSYMLKYGDSIRYQNEGMTTKLEGDSSSTEGFEEENFIESNSTEEISPDKNYATLDEVSTSDKITPTMKKDESVSKKVKKAMNMAPGMDKETQAEYKNLLELQLKLIDGISNMQPVLSEVAQKIDNMKKTMKS